MSVKTERWSSYLAALAVVAALTTPHLGSAHPLGNFSINRYMAMHLEPNAVVLRYIIDMAEIPAFQEIQDTRIVPQVGHPSLETYLTQRVDDLRSGLILELNGQRLPLSVESHEVMFPPGAGGLPTLKLGIRFRAALNHGSGASAHELRYRDTNFLGRAGWKEIIATARPEIRLVRSTVPEQDRSRELAEYPADILNSPPQDVAAWVIFTQQSLPPTLATLDTPAAGTPTSLLPPSVGDDRPVPRGRGSIDPARLEVNRQQSPQPSPRSSFTELVNAPQLGPGIVLVAMAVAVGLGAFHALEPGHGKTVVAAYLVGSRGTARHALLLGLIVTITHTAGVYALGAITLAASHYIVPERLYPWLGVTSGLIIAGLGLSLLLRRYAEGAHAHSHAHIPGHAHTHGHAHDDGHAHEVKPRHTHDHPPLQHHRSPSAVSHHELLALGVTGGIAPCPAALVVLLSALSLNRIGFGLLLIVAFSVGLAAVLIAIGILMVYAHRLMERFQGNGVVITRWLPLTSAAAMTGLGVAIAIQALVSADILLVQL